jgi:hypothetical protein
MIDGQPSALEQQIDEMIGQLASKNPAKRREAAYWLGEVAAENAVPELVEVYQKDKDARVRAAAAYSLGMYKAVEEALKRGEEAEVVELLKKIEQDGKLGARARSGGTIRTLIALTISLIALLVIFLLRDDIKGMFFGSTRTRAEVVSEVRQQFTPVRDDTRTLQAELLSALSNQPMGCIAFFNNPAPYRLNAVDARTYRDVGDMAAQLSAAQASLASAKASYDAACNNGAQFGAGEAQQTFQMLLPALQSLDPLEAQLTAAAQATPIPPTAILPTTMPTAAPTAAPTLNAELSPTIDPAVLALANPKANLPALFDIVNDVAGPAGASTVLINNWEQVQSTSSAPGCSTTPPAIPTLTLDIPDVDLQASPDLRNAVQSIRTGLDALGIGWANFRTACNNRTLREQAATELVRARTAAAAFTAAMTSLNAVQNS